MTLPEFLQSYGLVAVAVGTFLEGETVLLLAGAAASREHLSLPGVVAVATLAGFAGDQLFFHLGRRWGGSLLRRWPRLRTGVQRAQALLERHDTLVIVSVRFLYGLRVAGPLTIGMSAVPAVRFFALNLLGAFLWACAVTGVGYGSGHALAALLGTIDADGVRSLAVLLAVALAWLIMRRRLRKRRPTRGRGDAART